MRAATIVASATALAGAVLSAPLQARSSSVATWYEQKGVAGSCGQVSKDSDFIAALSSDMDPTSKCGQMLKVTNENNGKSVTVKAADSCPTCNDKSVDLSKGAFESLASLDEGQIPISFEFVSDNEKRELAKRYTGEATFYYQNGNAGSCGQVHSDSDKIAALPYAADPSGSCGRKLRVTNKDNGKSVEVVAADTCPTCSGEYSVDLSKAAFDTIGDESQGVLNVDWEFI